MVTMKTGFLAMRLKFTENFEYLIIFAHAKGKIILIHDANIYGEVMKFITKTCPCNMQRFFTAVKMKIFRLKKR